MCGIWAAFSAKPGTLNRAAAEKAVASLEPRGPEGTQLEQIPVGWLGFTRLAINGLTTAGMQPFRRRNVVWVANGEIYNWRELVAEYGLDCGSGSDCEVIGALYMHWRMTKRPLETLFQALDGVFACIIYDADKNQVIAARDPFGVRPLYRGKTPEGAIYFSSELKALPPGADVVHVKPGTLETFHMWPGEERSQFILSTPYHAIAPQPLPAFAAEAATCEAIRVALKAAVKKRLMTERPVAALLSGGIDSSLIASLVAHELRKAGAPKLKTFSIGMAGSEDLRYARRVAEWINSEHHEILVTAEEMIAAIPAVIRDIESFDTTTVRASVGNWLVARAVREASDCKVVFNGDGSDEVFGSYLYFANAPSEHAFAEEVQRLLAEIHRYDVLRSDRSISSHGLEARTPFLDKAFVQTVLSIPAGLRRPGPDRPEKFLLRQAFNDGVTLPVEVLWRRKEAFSDGVSGEKSWYLLAQEAAAAAVGDWETRAAKFKHLTPKTAEQFNYRSEFCRNYPDGWAATNVPEFWMPRWCGATDPSARTLTCYQGVL